MKKLLRLPALFLIMSMFFISMSSIAQMSILLVDDNAYDATRVAVIQTALTNNGYSYTDFTTSASGSPTYTYMSGFDLVIWYTGNDGSGLYFWNANDTDNQDIMDYIDNGGMFWLQGLDFLYDRYSGAPDTFVAGDFVYDYLGIEEYHAQSHIDDGVFSDGVPQFDVIPGNPIFTLTPLEWSYSTMWFADALVPTADADTIYRMGPTGYDFDTYYGSLYLEKGTGKVLTITTETARIDTQANTDTYFNEGLAYFEQFIGTTVLITDITVSGDGGATTIDVDNGTLQMSADILPVNATNQTVNWTVVDGTATATINTTGLLQATGTSAGNGTVWAKATAIDGSGIADSVEITISNQGSTSTISILLVDDNGYAPDRIAKIQTALTNNGYPYTDYTTSVEGSSPTYAYMSGFDLVIWYTGNDGGSLYFWNANDTDNQDIMDYIDNGGMFWLQGLDFLYDRYSGAPDTFVAGDFVYDYLGIEEYHAQSWADDGNTGVQQFDVVSANPIFTYTPMLWTYTEMHFADALVPTIAADTIYRMGPTGYDFDTYYGSLYLEKGTGKVLTITTETARIDTQTNTDIYIGQGVTYFEQFVPQTVLVTDIIVSGDGGATTIDIDNGTLQMVADILPVDATNQTVTWSVVDGTTTATIDAAGLLQATGTPAGNGTVYAKATANDGSGVVDSMMVTISNQGTNGGLIVLLVNDNNNGSDRYEVIETSLINLGYVYDVYNTITTQTYPDATTLSDYDAVIWYTGNDGVDLYLWDTTDVNDYKFNADLISYVDNGGIVWLQGLDYMYDVFGSAPDSFTSGQFIYDYMGIEEYHAQSHSDDGGTGLEQMEIVEDNGIFTISPVEWTYSEMWYVDALALAEDARGSYMMGPESYVFSDYYCGLYKYHNQNGLVMSFTVETARIDNQINTDTLINQGLNFFNYFIDNSPLLVEDLDVYTDGGINYIIDDGGTLQMYAEALPMYANDLTVTWSVVDGTATATIDADGLLQGTGTPAGNGTVYAKATANDGSGVADSMMVTISNQGSGSEFSVLLLNDNDNDAERYEVIETSLINLGYTYDIYNTITTQTYPDFYTLSGYSAVIWYTGNDGVDLYLWDISDTTDYKFNDQLIQYIDAGGIVWLQGIDYLYDVFGSAPDVFVPGQFVYDYMGIEEYHGQSHVDDGGVGLVQMDIVEDNGIFAITPVMWTYSDMWYADALALGDDARGSYLMGPESYVFSSYYCGLYKYHNEDGIVMNFTIETARIDNQDNTDTLIDEGLSFFDYYLNNTILVESIFVVGENDIDYIDEDGGTLQMYADVLPQFVPNNNVLWSVTDGTTTATISADGLLQASGTLSGNGTVWAVATADDGSGIADSLLVTISNQGIPADYLILLVNDNDNGSDRYLVLDTTLLNLGYDYDVYNTIETGDFPDFATLDLYDLVIWYTGNDGTDLYLWDISDTTDYKFNEPLINYIDNGGDVWLQGLDFLYDIVGGAPDTFEDGQFIYNYMGIEEYFAQSYADDGGIGLAQMDVVPNNGICSISPIEWTYSTLWYADAIAVVEGTNTIYQMGPDTYVFADYFTAFNRWVGEGCVMTFTVETARIDTRENTEELFFEVIEYFKLTTGVDELADEDTGVMIYPNPTSGNITLHNTGSASIEIGLFELYDVNGRKVISRQVDFATDMDISLSGIQKGFYIYSITSGNNIITGKIVKQ